MINTFQKDLITTIDNFTSLPHSILLIGDYGAGHEEVCSYIANKFNLMQIDITNSISLSTIDEIYQSSSMNLYTIDLSVISEREQNILLKLYEEPNSNTYIILNCESADNIIDTIKSRSYQLKFANYTKDQLKEFLYSDFTDFEKDIILELCTTPKQIEIANNTRVKDLYDMCCKLITSIQNVNIQNLLSVANKINYSDEYSKFDLRLFMKMIKYALLVNNVNNKLELYSIINKTSKYIYHLNNKQQSFEHMLILMKNAF